MRFLSPGKLLLALAALVAATAAVLAIVPDRDVYLYLPDEPHLVEPLVTVEGGQPVDDEGGLYFVDVIVRQPSLLEGLAPGLFHDGASVVPAHAVNPTGLSERARRQASLRVMTRSQEIAAAVALEAAGEDVLLRTDGAFVAQVLPGTPAAGLLHPADVIVQVDSEPVDTLDQLRELLGARSPGDEVSLVVRRGKEERRFRLRLAADPNDAGRAFIGVGVEQSVEVRLPVDVEIDTGNVGGPSAGLAFALGILEELGRDIDGGRRIAVTGALAPDGAVQSVGGLKQKTIGAREAGVDVFVVPAGDNAEEARRYADGMRIVAVQSFQQALRALATLGRNSQD
ncbi:MAG: PDZ domain-containing protein [Gaiellaceae bacterium]